jgi:hypothetical protein
VLPQLRALEVAVADNRLGKDETDCYEMPCYNIPEGSPPKGGVIRLVRADSLERQAFLNLKERHFLSIMNDGVSMLSIA